MGVTRRTFLKTTGATLMLGALDAGQSHAGHSHSGQDIPVQLPGDDALLDKVQKQTLRYFWDFAYPETGMIRERTNNMQEYGREIVSSGATGMGIMALIVGKDRGWLTYEQVASRLSSILRFLEKADHVDGIFPHFFDAKTGKAQAIFQHDNGGDIVETSFLMMGLLTARQHFSGNTPEEKDLRSRINALWERADWSKHQRRNPDSGKNELMWHRSPEGKFLLNLPVTGWNEALITYVLAASSPTHPIDSALYHESWCKGNDFINGKPCGEGITLPLGPEGGGPLFLSHYSFLGLSPEGLKDAHADYWQQNVSHTLLNRQHCIRNPKGYKGYGPSCWGLTSSDDPSGYDAHSPTNDNGTITPSAALSSFPYTPHYSMEALRHFHDRLGDKIFGEYGFADAFNESKNWVAPGCIGIDQGPIVVMIENMRSGKPWEYFMSAPEVIKGLKTLGFESPYIGRQPRALIHLQRQSSDAADFMRKLCGPEGYKPMNDKEFASCIGLGEDAQWQVRQLRSGSQLLSSAQQAALLEYCGYCDPNEMAKAKVLLASQPLAQLSIK